MGKIEESKSKQQCCVPQCKSRATNEISLFRFPKEESQRKKWADAIKIEKGISPHMQVCSRHFVKNDYIMADGPSGTKVKRLKKSALPSQNLPWQFPNKRVSPTLAKARMERLKNRSMQKSSDSPVKSDTPTKKPDGTKKSEPTKKPEGKKSEPESKTSSEKSEEEPKNNEEIPDNDEKMSAEDASADVKSEKGDQTDENNEEAVEENSGETIEAKKDESNMKGRGPTRLRQQTGILKCEHCGRKCLTPQALQTHQQIAHKHVRISHINSKNTPIKPSPKPTVPMITVRDPATLQKPNILRPKLTKPVEKSLNSSEVEKVLLEDSDFTEPPSDSDWSVKEDKGKPQQRKTEFECPICKRRFTVFFMANRHIQKYHGPQNGSKTPNLLPKPHRIELCTICNSTVESTIHICSGPLKLAMGFVCMGCEQEYKTLTMFDMHKSSRHNDGVESMFFPSLDEFEAWKQRMEQQTLVSYSIMDQNDTKQIHRCSHRAGLGAGSYSRQRLCPSSVVVQEFTKGFQVHYYPNHYDHPHEKYTLSKAFKKYSISSLMNLTASTLPDSEDDDPAETDLYLQFKKVTNVLVTEAARINVNGLKKLMRKALDMIAIVNSYVEDDDDDIITSSVIKLDPDSDDLQEQVNKVLKSLKRPSEKVEATPVKRRKAVFQSRENLKNKEVKTRSFTPVNVKERTENTENSFEKTSPLKNQSVSFIDTFQDFVGKTLEKSADKKKRQSDGKKTPTVKTKIGQFKPKSPPKKALSPKSPKTPKASPKSTAVKEIEYEVKEQENDCNILILKI